MIAAEWDCFNGCKHMKRVWNICLNLLCIITWHKTSKFSFTPWSRVLQKLIVVQLLKKYLSLYGNQWFHIHMILPWASWTQLTQPFHFLEIPLTLSMVFRMVSFLVVLLPNLYIFICLSDLSYACYTLCPSHSLNLMMTIECFHVNFMWSVALLGSERKFTRQFHSFQDLHNNTFQNFLTEERTGMFIDRKSKHHKVLTERKLDEVRAWLECSPPEHTALHRKWDYVVTYLKLLVTIFSLYWVIYSLSTREWNSSHPSNKNNQKGLWELLQN